MTAELREFKNIHDKTFQRQLQLRMIKKCLQKEGYISPEERQKIIDNLILNIIIIIINFILIQEIGLTESLSSWNTFTDSNSGQLSFLNVITQTLETVNVDLELGYLHLFKTSFNNYA